MAYSTACERNKQPILAHLKSWLTPGDTILEIGSGTGQHGTYFASQLPAITWQCSDLSNNLNALNERIKAANLANLPLAYELDAGQHPTKNQQFNVIYTANTLHIMPWETSLLFLSHIHQRLTEQGQLIIYGPFRYQNQFTSDSNAQFDSFLKQHDPERGIRDFESVAQVLEENNLELIDDHNMPAHNQLLRWQYCKDPYNHPN